MEPAPDAEASRYRREAEHLRHAIEMIDDPRLREQLLSFAQQYDAAAALIEQELKVQSLEIRGAE